MKSLKVIYIIAIFTITALIAAIVLGVRFGRCAKFAINNSGAFGDPVTNSVSADAFTEIELKADIAAFEIKKGSDYHVEYTFPSNFTVKVKSSDGKLTVKYKKVSKNCKGYQIQISTSKSFFDPTTKTTTKTKLTIKKLTKGKTYYVRVRAYNKSGSSKVYGKWSAVKSVTIK